MNPWRVAQAQAQPNLRRRSPSPPYRGRRSPSPYARGPRPPSPPRAYSPPRNFGRRPISPYYRPRPSSPPSSRGRPHPIPYRRRPRSPVRRARSPPSDSESWYRRRPAPAVTVLQQASRVLNRSLELFKSDKKTYFPEIAEENVEGEEGGQEPMSSTNLPAPHLKFKRVDFYLNWWSKDWKYKTMGAKVITDRKAISSIGDGDPWADYCFVFVRTLPSNDNSGNKRSSFKFVVKSRYLLKACKDVIQEVPGISWNADPLELEPELLIGFLPRFERYHDELARKKPKTDEDKNVIASLRVLMEFIHKEYKRTLYRIKNLTSHGEITADLLYAIMVPRTVLLTKCPISGEPRALQLISVNKAATMGGAISELILESVDMIDDPEQLSTSQFGRVRNRMIIISWKGTIKINSLDAYPIDYHPNAPELKENLLTRGRKWASLNGAHHRHYNGIAAHKLNNKVIRYNLNCRIMIDRVTFRRINSNYAFPIPKESDNQDLFDESVPTLNVGSKHQKPQEHDLTDEDLLLAAPVVYGFSLMDKMWLEFNVEMIHPIAWNTEAFDKLVLPANRKELLRTLVEAHTQDLGFDDFVKGKGQGLVINLFGPPGSGKTLSVEAISDIIQRPLYVVGAGDLGTSAFVLNESLEEIFDITTSWKAIVLIDEADVFMEQRSLHDLDRNAMVSVILRHVEYYSGILFITTNRVKAIDKGFRSRTHVALHFRELTVPSKEKVWTAFLEKVGITVGSYGRISEAELRALSERQLNGRQIKNAVRTAGSLALGRNQRLGYMHFVETLDAMDDFTVEFGAVKG